MSVPNYRKQSTVTWYCYFIIYIFFRYIIFIERTGIGETGFGETEFGESGFGETWFDKTGFGGTGFSETGFGENSASLCTLNLPHPLALLISPHYFHRLFCWSHMNHCFHTLNRRKFSFMVYLNLPHPLTLLISPHFITYFVDHTWTIVFLAIIILNIEYYI